VKQQQTSVFIRSMTGNLVSTITKDVLMVGLGSVLIAVSARIVIPFWPVPVSGQTFAVLLIAALLGSRKGMFSVLAYIGGGIAGLPVFASGSLGVLTLAGPTAGYLYGFIAAAFMVGWLLEKGWHQRSFSILAAFIIGNMIIYLSGLAWLSHFIDGNQLLMSGLLPFLPGDMVKIFLAFLSYQGIQYFSEK